MLDIGGLIPFTTIDYPGNLSAVVFCQGCPWRCRYCHNRHIQHTGRHGKVSWDEIVELFNRRHALLDAVVFSGGEPTMQPRLPEALKAIRELGFKVGLHTAGPYPERLLDCLPWLDWVGMDIKAPFEEYEAITGISGSGSAARRSAGLLCNSAVNAQFRTTLDPFLQANGRIERMRRMVERWGKELVVQSLVIVAHRNQ